MPYEITQRGSQYCVVKQGTSQSMGCHDTREEALRQMRAIVVNEVEEEMAKYLGNPYFDR